MRSGLRAVSLVFLSLLLAVRAYASAQMAPAVHHTRAPRKYHVPARMSRLAGRFTSVENDAGGADSGGTHEEPQEASIVLGNPP